MFITHERWVTIAPVVVTQRKRTMEPFPRVLQCIERGEVLSYFIILVNNSKIQTRAKQFFERSKEKFLAKDARMKNPKVNLYYSKPSHHQLCCGWTIVKCYAERQFNATTTTSSFSSVIDGWPMTVRQWSNLAFIFGASSTSWSNELQTLITRQLHSHARFGWVGLLIGVNEETHGHWLNVSVRNR